MLCLMFLLPVPTFLGEVAARSADMVRFGSVFTHLFTRARFGRGKHIRRITIILLLMFLCAFLSFVAGESHSIRDLLDVFRIAAFCAVFIFGALLCWRGQSQFDAAVSFSKFLLLIGTLNAMFTLAQYTFPIATRPVQAFYANDERHIDLLPEQGRAFGFFGNPNTNAVMLLLLSLPGLVAFQLTGRSRYLALAFFVFTAVLLTACRTGMILGVVMVAVICVASRKLSYLAALAVAAWVSYELLAYLVTTGTLKDWSPYLSELLTKIYGALQGDHFDVNSIHSFNARLAIWDDAMRVVSLESDTGCRTVAGVDTQFFGQLLRVSALTLWDRRFRTLRHILRLYCYHKRACRTDEEVSSTRMGAAHTGCRRNGECGKLYDGRVSNCSNCRSQFTVCRVSVMFGRHA